MIPFLSKYLSFYSVFRVQTPVSFPVGFYPMQRWAAAPDSDTLKCISCKILPFCASVIFQKKRRNGFFDSPLEAS